MNCSIKLTNLTSWPRKRSNDSMTQLHCQVTKSPELFLRCPLTERLCHTAPSTLQAQQSFGTSAFCPADGHSQPFSRPNASSRHPWWVSSAESSLTLSTRPGPSLCSKEHPTNPHSNLPATLWFTDFWPLITSLKIGTQQMPVRKKHGKTFYKL